MADLVDETRECRGCRTPFVFTVRDQEFYAKMGFGPPNRCKLCRDKRKAETNQQQQSGRPQGVSASQPILEYAHRPRLEVSRPEAPRPDRQDKNDGRRRNNRHWRDHGDGADW